MTTINASQLPEYFQPSDGTFVYNIEIPEPAMLIYHTKEDRWEGETLKFDDEESDWVTDQKLSQEEATELAKKHKLITNKTIDSLNDNS